MPLFGRAIEDITEQVLQSLIDDEGTEGKSIDYKLELNLEKGDDKKEFLADITSFANTAGGHLLIGIKPDGDHAVELVGMEAPPEKQDRIKQQIENLLRDSIDPRLPPLQQRFVSLTSGKHILVLRIGQSWAGPHMVRTSSKFFARNSAGKFHLDTQQLRAAFAATDDLGRRMGLWRTERIGKILANEAPWTLPAGPRLIVHLMPQASFAGLRMGIAPQHQAMLPLLGRYTYPSRPNFDGWISRANDGRSLTQLFRNGCLECADAYTLGYQIDQTPETVVRSVELEIGVADFVTAGLATLHDLGLQAPVFACVTLAGIKGRRLIRRNDGPQGDPVPQDILVLPEAQIDDINDKSQSDVFALLRPVFDVLWQAFGNHGSRNYDSNGEWRGS
jgi:hypothetical protein